MRAYLALAAVALALGVVWYAYATGRDHGAAACAADHARHAAQAQAAIDLRDQHAATARADMLDYLRVTIPPMETRTHETVERIRTVYRDRPLPAVCARPDGLQAELDAARERANRAARGM